MPLPADVTVAVAVGVPALDEPLGTNGALDGVTPLSPLEPPEVDFEHAGNTRTSAARLMTAEVRPIDIFKRTIAPRLRYRDCHPRSPIKLETVG